MSGLELVLALAIAIGLAGILVPVLPGTVLILGAVLVWAFALGGATAWSVFAVAAVVLIVGGMLRFTVPGRHLEDAGIPASTKWAGALLGVIGFFVIPVVGLFLGFPLGVYLAEVRRVGSAAAWPSTRHALRAVGLSILIDLLSGVLATLIWVVGVVLT